ncbi:MAG: hypothetical protein KatS3mg014_1584 [Actinomycetota bacterium]|nr:MAG: hypothetical protein KatS3mg014_1584 [Actinomycetota bacterium]
MLVLEDAHLAEPGLLDLIEELVRSARRIPLLVLCVARYDLLDTRPGWGGGLGDSLNLYLEPLADADATELALQAGEGLDREVAESVARHRPAATPSSSSRPRACSGTPAAPVCRPRTAGPSR